MIAHISELAGRVLLSAIFLISGLGKIGAYANTQAYMESQGVPGAVLPAVILLEVLAPLLLIAGWQTRLAALALAGFSLASALLFHLQPQDQLQTIMLLKNISMAGGFLIVAAHGAGRFSLDARGR
jgi:putative oxidoreductase